MLKSSKQGENTEEVDWKKHLTPEEFKAAAEIKKILISSQPIKAERASLERYTISDTPKDPYELFQSTDPKSRGELHTDGKITRNKVFPLASGEMQSVTIADYNYIILKQHLPNPKNNGSDSWYQSIVTKTYGLKLYVQSLFGLGLG